MNRTIPAAVAISALLAALPAPGEVYTEHFFTNALAVAEPGNVESVFDFSRNTDNNRKFKLYRGDGYTSEILAEPTGLGDRWQEFLRTGYLTVQNTSAWNTRKMSGIRTTGYACHIIGPNQGVATTGTFYTLFRPRAELGWASNKRNALWGFGHTGNSTLVCWKSANSTDLLLDFTVKTPVATNYLVRLNPGEGGWKYGAWYLVAASFPGVAGEAANAQARLWMRELSPRGPTHSPAGICGVVETGKGYAPFWPSWDPGKSGVFGSKCDMGIGGYLYNPGDNVGLVNQLGGDICYFRAESEYLDYSDFETFFESLAFPYDNTTLLMLR